MHSASLPHKSPTTSSNSICTTNHGSQDPPELRFFCPELLSRRYYYARTSPDVTGVFHEESDCYAEALACLRIATECFTTARDGSCKLLAQPLDPRER